MAKQEGLIRLRGTIDGVNFYFRKGKPIARKAGGGFNGASIKTVLRWFGLGKTIRSLVIVRK